MRASWASRSACSGSPCAIATWRARSAPPSDTSLARALSASAEAVIDRRKPVVLQRASPLGAVVVMDAMDYDVHLFTDAETGEDAVVYRAGPSRQRLAPPALHVSRMVVVCARLQPAGAADCEFPSDTNAYRGRRGGPGV